MTETKLTKQSEAILDKLRRDVEQHRLSPEELSKIRKGLALVESLGILGELLIKAAAAVTAIVILWNTFSSGGTQR